MLVSNRFSTRHVGAPTKAALSVLSLKGNRRNELEQVREGWVCLLSKIDQYQQSGEGAGEQWLGCEC